MLAFIEGQVLFSDGKETILKTTNGVGYQLHSYSLFPEGSRASLFISHVIRENAEELFSFQSIREKKLFELLRTVKGVGPKSAYAVMSSLPVESIISSILTEDKKTLTKVNGVGTKAASQMILDLKNKITKVKMYSSDFFENEELEVPRPSKPETIEVQTGSKILEAESGQQQLSLKETKSDFELQKNQQEILSDTLLACENLGFSAEQIVPLAQRFLKENEIQRAEQLVHLVLKEI